MNHPDQQYIDALLNNDARLIDTLYQKFSGKIKWMVLQNGGNETDAEDIFQEALLALYEKAKKENFQLTCPLEAFLYLVCKNKWISRLRKRKTQKVTFTDTERYNISDDTFSKTEECNTQQARRKLMLEKLAELGTVCKELLLLSWSGKGMEEVAGLMNISYAYARKRKSECVAKLATLVKESPEYLLYK